ncbi:glycosyltransferase [Microbacterium sp. X-17]|uniref:glycosyltransferase n=1 Tax=Microbacterium sp. X-17 TaxID=3144404 RepID=UPI0031F49C9D
MSVRRGESTYYLLAESAGRLVGDAAAVLLGGWESPAYWQIARAARRRGARRVGFYESTLASMGHRAGPIAGARRRFFQGLDAVVVPGIAARDAVRSLGVGDDRIHLGFNAVDVAGFHAAQQPGAEGPGHGFVYVGQLIERKNVAALIEAFGLIRATHDTLTIIGEGELRPDLTRLVELFGLSGYVDFRGAVPYSELPATLGRAQTLVLPSLVEVWGLVANEALASGCHVVVSEIAGVAPSIADMDGVFLCQPGVASIARAMRASREQWEGRIVEPAILTHTPERFADVFRAALLS